MVATVLEIGSLFSIYKWSYGEPLIRSIIAGPILMGCMFLMRTHRLGLVFFAVAIVAIYGQTFPAMLDYPEVVVLNAVVYRCWPLSNLADDVNRRAVVSQSCHFAKCIRRLMIGLMMPLAT